MPTSTLIAYLGETFETFVRGDVDVAVWLHRLMFISFLITLLAVVVLGSKIFLQGRHHR